MKKQYYFESANSETCWTADYFESRMIEEGVKEITVYAAIPDKIPGVFWCTEHLYCGDDSAESCGNQCIEYEPRNGKNGCCRHHRSTVYELGGAVKLTLDS